MPTVFIFDGYKIRIYFNDHGIPHVHLIGTDWAGVIAIADGDLIEGEAPEAALATAREWIAQNEQMLLSMWRK